VRSNSIVQLVGKRLLVLPILLFIISLGVFSLLYLAPGSVEEALLGTRTASPQLLQQIRHEYHLDQPFFTQYWIWLRNAVQLNFGVSVVTGEPVRSVISRDLGDTIFLGLYAFVLALSAGLVLGVVAALKRRTAVDRGVVGLSVIAVSAPAFATGIILLYALAVAVHWFPVYGEGSGFFDRIYHLTLPAVALALTAMALVVKLTRAAMIAALDQDYIAFAHARGVASHTILTRYALRNALIPVMTSAGMILGFMLTGAVLVEVTFALPGIGSELVNAVSYKDVPLVQGIAITIATVIVLVNLMTDVAYLVVDPRVRAQAEKT
jgi:peptide/nickel transport system permease protein